MPEDAAAKALESYAAPLRAAGYAVERTSHRGLTVTLPG